MKEMDLQSRIDKTFSDWFGGSMQAPIDVNGLYEMFDRANSDSFYRMSGAGRVDGGSTRCCATGTCDNFE